jgi:hypothetical protein
MNVVIAVVLLACGLFVDRISVKSTARAGRSFLVPLGMARLLILAGLILLGMVLAQAIFSHW